MALPILALLCAVLSACAHAEHRGAESEAAQPQAATRSEAMSAPSPNARDPASARAAFAKLKALAGTWTWQPAGKTEVALQSRVSSGGSVVVETMFPGTPHEMTNVYSVDGEALIVTHYCAAGNQPRLAARPEADSHVLQFVLRDATAVDPRTGNYMGELTLTLVDPDRIVQQWRHFAGSTPGEISRFEFVRQK